MTSLASEWNFITADEYCSSVRDGTHDSPKFVDQGYPLVTSRNIKGGLLELASANIISPHDYEEINRRSKVDQWDVLYSMIGTIGEVYLVESDQPEFAIKNVGLFKCNTEEDGRWLSYWLKSSHAGSYVRERLRGSTQQYIPLGELRKLPILIPANTNERQQIIHVIKSYDDLIEINRQRIALLEESARLLYREWFVKLRFPGHDTENGLPKGWAQKTLADLATLNYGKALKAEVRKDGDIPVYGSSGIVGYHNESLINGHCIIIGRKGNVGSVFYSHEPCFAIDTVFYINSEQTSYYLMLVLQNMNFISSDAAVPGLNRNYAYSLPVIVPDETTANAFEELVAPIFGQVNVLEKINKNLSEARDALLPKLMSGQLAV